MVELALNELSLLELAPNDQVARDRLERFVGLVGNISKGLRSDRAMPVRTARDVLSQEISRNYTMLQFVNDNRVSFDNRTYLLTILSGPPFSDDGLTAEERDFSLRWQVVASGQNALGFLFAFRKSGMALSLDSAGAWDRPFVEVSTRSLDEDGSLIEAPARVRHASTEAHLESHRPWFSALLKSVPHDAKSLVERRGSLFPHVIFCADAEKQILEDLNQHQVFSLMKSLTAIEAYCAELTGPVEMRGLRRYGLALRPESEATLNKYGKDRLFRTPDGKRQMFTWHFDISPGAFRAYISASSDGSGVLLSYVGKHLRTQKYQG